MGIFKFFNRNKDDEQEVKQEIKKVEKPEEEDDTYDLDFEDLKEKE